MKTLRKKFKRLDGYRRNLFWSLSLLLLLSASLYAYLVNAVALHAIAYGKARESARAVSAALSEREALFLTLKQRVTLPRAHALGFQDARAVRFIATERLRAALPLSEEPAI